MEYQLRYKMAAVDFLSSISLEGFANELSPIDINIINKNKANDNAFSSCSGGEMTSNSGDKKISEGGSTKLKPHKLIQDVIYQRYRKRNTSSSSLSSLNDEDKELSLKQISTKQRLVVVSPSHRTSFSVYSILSFSKCVKFVKHDGTVIEKSEQPRLRLISGNSSSTNDNILAFGLLQIPTDEDVSYQHFLKPIIYTDTKLSLLNVHPKPQANVSPTKSPKPIETKYDPNMLDDPEMITSRSKVVLNLPGYLTTIVNYVRPIDVKIDINEQFRQKFPEINLTLTKLRSLKLNILNIANKTNIDLWTVANAFVYFEMLVLKNLVSKSNRKLCCAASFVLSAKINDVKRTDLNLMLQELESAFKTHKREILQFELYIFVALEFGLLLHDRVINVHYRRLIRNK